ncbi:lytic transglycosylase domain-containing protein [Derxia gummosa]|uniref:Lytic transglycosylase domain-containing protein n=1 Tax=Derxia gummosa DSM 723 TaxID=1121388 RepID=A0A8B6XC01_9BURK|nr:lytic transglycosylase domain-containing protein [Derxia gummosa]
MQMTAANVVNQTATAGGNFRVVIADVVSGMVICAKKGFALLGIVTLCAAVFGFINPEARTVMKQAATDMSSRVLGVPKTVVVVQREAPDADAIQTATREALEREQAALTRPVSLTREQRAAANFLASKYKLAPEAIGQVVAEAFRTGQQLKVDPLLLLAVMSIESSMNPFAQSPMGARGLMQVMPVVHADKLSAFGGATAAFHPLVNIRVGAQVLRETIERTGSVEAGLRAYLGAQPGVDDNGYGERVMSERARIEAAMRGVRQPVQTAANTVAKAPERQTEAPGS